MDVSAAVRDAIAEDPKAPNGSGESAAHSYRADVDGLRAVAVLAVVLFHAGVPGFSGGFVGVDVFFVISGFLISSIIFKGLSSGTFSFADFYARRIRRIFPALILVLVAVWVFGWFETFPQPFTRIGTDIEGAAGFVSNILLWGQSGYFDREAILKPLLHLWSLGIEEQFYLIWPITLVAIWKVRSRFLVLLTLLAVSFYLNVSRVRLDQEATFYLPHTRFWELLIGGCIAYVEVRRQDGHEWLIGSWWRQKLAWGPSKSRVLCNASGIAGLILIAAGIVRLSESSLFPGYAALLPTVGSALVISGGANAWANRWILSRKPVVLIGLISYPLYLWHWPLLTALRMLSRDRPSIVALSLAVGLGFLLAWMTYRFIELPVRRGIGIGARRGVVLIVLIIAMGGIGSLGLLTVRSGGFPSRLSGDAYQLMTQKDEQRSLWRQNRCFLDTKTLDWRSFSSECVDVDPKGAPLVFLWGDSHAADLYPGIRKLQSSSNSFRLAQFNSSSCPPILKYQAPWRNNCAEINDHVLERVVESRPDTVILVSEYWPVGDTVSYLQMSQTLVSLKEAGVRRIVMVGADPEWQLPLPVLLVRECTTVSNCPIPSRFPLRYLLSQSIKDDRELGAWARSAGVIYLSTIDQLCNADGCMTRIQSGDRSELTTLDKHHLTPLASEYVAGRLFSSDGMAALGKKDH